jgi:hypothetical protein
MKAILIGAILGTFYFMVANAIERSYNRGFAEGRGMALKTNPPSEELEMTCAGLWVGEQNKKYWNKQNAR